MAITQTERLGLTRWSVDGDAVTREQFDDDHAGLEALGAGYLQGTLGARPAASAANKGFFYYATDNGLVYYSTGAAWATVGSSPDLSNYARKDLGEGVSQIAAKLAADVPGAYPDGVSMFLGAAGDGFPTNGPVLTWKLPGSTSRVYQRQSSSANGVVTVHERASTTGGAWGAWRTRPSLDGSHTVTGRYDFEGAAGAVKFGTYRPGDAVSRMVVDADGKFSWGPGNAAQDTSLARTGPGILSGTVCDLLGVATPAMANIAFTSIPTAYQFFVIEGYVNPSASGYDLWCRINNDTGAGYRHHRLTSVGTTVAGTAAAVENKWLIGNINGRHQLRMVFTRESLFMMMMAQTVGIDRTSTTGCRNDSGFLTRIDLFFDPASGAAFAAGTRLHLYGMR